MLTIRTLSDIKHYAVPRTLHLIKHSCLCFKYYLLISVYFYTWWNTLIRHCLNNSHVLTGEGKEPDEDLLKRLGP